MVKQVTPHAARRRAASQGAADYEDVDEPVHLALAISRILAGIGRSGAARYGDDLVELIEHHLPAADTQLITDPGRPRLTELRALGKALGNGQAPITPLDRRIGWLSDELGFDAADRVILGVLVRCSLRDPWHRLLRLLPPWGGAPTVTKLAILSGLPARLVDQRLAPGSPLRRSELVRDDGDGEYALARLLSEVLRRPAASPEQLVSWLMPDGEVPSLSWDDFAHLPPRDLAAQVLAARQGVSVLLFGKPGTGKTEFARVLAARTGCIATFAGRSVESGSEPGLGGARGGGVGLFASRGIGRSTTLAARKADKARPIWIGLKGGIALFLVLCVVFASDHLDDPFGAALALTVAAMIIVPAATAIRAELLNRDYDRRWHCETCGELWTHGR